MEQHGRIAVRLVFLDISQSSPSEIIETTYKVFSSDIPNGRSGFSFRSETCF
jgi:hypothetical protein